uniref:Uncharacterized protein n=1 Tax=Octopus bimaculoides TaxID=37653 RepID=A0A0L8HKG6_OCTBM
MYTHIHIRTSTHSASIPIIAATLQINMLYTSVLCLCMYMHEQTKLYFEEIYSDLGIQIC